MHSIEYFTNLKEVIRLRGRFSVAHKGNAVRPKFWLIDSRMVWAVYLCAYICQHICMCVEAHAHVCVGV